MKKSQLLQLVAVGAILAIALAVSFAGSWTGESTAGVRVFAICAAIAFAMQWVAFIPAYIARTEHFFDLTGSATYITLAVVGLSAAGNWEPRSLIIAGLVIVWAMRLGSFLFLRVRASGSDRRFDDLKRDFLSFFMTWTLQGMWVLLTFAAGLAAMTSSDPEPLEWIAFVGIAIWAIGFGIEAVADSQKRSFRKDPANSDKFITRGLWAWSRHPNYFGEIVLWVGIAVIAAPALTGWQWVTMVSPLFVIVLLTRVSGIPLLEERARKRWGDDPEYRAYRATTPALLPRPPRQM